jgi:hypothetical protein
VGRVAWRVLLKGVAALYAGALAARLFFFPLPIFLNMKTLVAFLSGAIITLFAVFLIKTAGAKSSPPIPPPDFSTLKRDLAGLNIVLDGGLDVDSGLTQIDDFKKCLEDLQVDYEVQEPKPNRDAIDQIVLAAKAIVQLNALYKDREYQIHAFLDARVNALNGANQKISDLMPGFNAEDELDRQNGLLKKESAAWGQAQVDLITQSHESAEWKNLKSSCEQFQPILSAAIENLTLQEHGEK